MSRPTASALARAFGCPGSFALARAEMESEWATLGHEEHEKLSDPDNLDEKLSALIPPDSMAEVKLAYDVALRTGRIIGQGSDRNYGTLAPFEIAGSCDWLGRVDNCAVIVDWKTGWNEVEPASSNAQLWFYALAAARALGCDEAIVRIVYTRIGRVDEYTIDEIEMAGFANRMEAMFGEVARQQKKDIPDTREGSWCKYCPSKVVCPTKVGMIRQFAATGDDLVQIGRAPLTQQEAAEAYRKLVNVDGLVREAKQRLDKWVEENGPIDLGQGRAYGPFVKRGNEKLDARIVATAISETCGEMAQQVINDSMSWSVTKAALKRAAGSLDKKIIARARELGGVSAEMQRRIGEHLQESDSE